jgi:hypothetical protein
VARGIEFRSNKFTGCDFGVSATRHPHSYTVYWTLRIEVMDSRGHPVAGLEVTIRDRDDAEVARAATGADGKVSVELPQYEIDDDRRTDFSPYTVVAEDGRELVELDTNREITLTLP